MPNSLKKAPITMFSLCSRDCLFRREISRSMITPTMSTSSGQEGEIDEEVEEEVAAVAEDGEIERVDDGRQDHHGDAEQHEPAAVRAVHRAISTGTLA